MDINLPRIRVALSDCLQGRACRYNGDHALDSFVKQQLSKYADYYAFCPESAVIGTPRETINLISISDQLEVVGSQTGTNYKDALQSYVDLKVDYFTTQNIDAAVVKSRSPSCGLVDVKLYDEFGEWKSSPVEFTQGVFTQSLQSQNPYIAIEDEKRLHDPWLREQFLIQAFALARWRQFMASSPSLSDFQTFHQRVKYLLQAKNERIYRTMGPIVAQANKVNLPKSLLRYQQAYLRLMDSEMNRGQVENAFDHMLGYFKQKLSIHERTMYSEILAIFREEKGDLIHLVNAIQMFVDRYGSEYLQNQFILQPYPEELASSS